ncbi:MAG: ribosomal protein S18-alanine N-acetyltransferase [Ruminococcus sp.]|nr:ribosomal protein S18-alanine N-acetyltransferase [Ruminococcus sp.]
MIVEKMTESHLNEVVKIEEKSFTNPWSRESFYEELLKPLSFKFVALENGKVVGFAVLDTVLDEGNLLDIAVDESYRRNGVGRILMNALFEVAKEKSLSFITLEVRESSSPAIALYEAFGFERVGMRKNYYSKPNENALLMTKYFEKV